MAKLVPLHITSGLPYSRTITVTLPNGRTWWTIGTQFEVLSQIRESSDEASPLLLDLKQFLVVTFTAPNTVGIVLTMSGTKTRLLKKSGYYDMVISDTLNTDSRAFVLVSGPVYRDSVVTADVQELG
jgi:hypothetical protein